MIRENTMHTEELMINHNDTKLINYIAYDEKLNGEQPAVIIVPAFEGRVETYDAYARQCAELGYVGIAVDMYGDRQIGSDVDTCMGFITPFFQDRRFLQDRIVTLFEAIQKLSKVDANKIAAFGFCFGGMAVLDLARTGADVKAVASLHGILAAPENLANQDISSNVLALHGYDDPQVPPTQLADFAKEMDSKGADWQMTYYGGTKHAFTDPNAAKIGAPEMGRVYNPIAAKRAWQACQNLFTEVF